MFVLDHDPHHDDLRAFLGRLQSALQARDLTLLGITTDGSALYREPLAEIFDGVPHQVCQFHVIKELTQGVLQAVAKERERLARSKPKLKRGRPSSKDKAARRPKKQSHPRENQRFVPRSLLVCQASPEAKRTQTTPVHHPRLTAVAQVA